MSEENKVPVYNPLEEDFFCTYDINNDKNPVTFKVRAGTVGFFDPIIADHIKKHLATEVMNHRTVKTNYKDEYEAVIKDELTVKL